MLAGLSGNESMIESRDEALFYVSS